MKYSLLGSARSLLGEGTVMVQCISLSSTWLLQFGLSFFLFSPPFGLQVSGCGVQQCRGFSDAVSNILDF